MIDLGAGFHAGQKAVLRLPFSAPRMSDSPHFSVQENYQENMQNVKDKMRQNEGRVVEIEPAEWPTWQERVASTVRLAGVEIRSRDGRSVFVADGKGGLRGYESH